MRFFAMLASTLQVSLLLSVLILAGHANAATTQVDGVAYPLPNVPGMQEVHVKLTKNQIQALSEEASKIKIPKAGFKVLTTNLAFCKNFQSKKVNIKHLPRPFFVVGDNPTSIAWIKKYKPELEKVNAIGLVVSAKSIASLKALKSEAGNMALYPANGNALREMFGVNCYPVLISKHLIEH
jgi:integrating conjugative element protein (TIGR03765 family)